MARIERSPDRQRCDERGGDEGGDGSLPPLEESALLESCGRNRSQDECGGQKSCCTGLARLKASLGADSEDPLGATATPDSTRYRRRLRRYRHNDPFHQRCGASVLLVAGVVKSARPTSRVAAAAPEATNRTANSCARAGAQGFRPSSGGSSR